MSLDELLAVPSSPVEPAAPHEAAVDEAPRLDLVLPDSPLDMSIAEAQAESATENKQPSDEDQVSIYDLPNPYDHVPAPPVLLTPPVSTSDSTSEQAQPRRLPSVLRPGHLRSLHSRSASMAFLGDFPYGQPNPAFATSEIDFRHSFASDGDQYDRFYSWEEPPASFNAIRELQVGNTDVDTSTEQPAPDTHAVSQSDEKAPQKLQNVENKQLKRLTKGKRRSSKWMFWAKKWCVLP